ncbi:MAG: TetR/AcrR family transcriptional regulator, partial [Chromatiales bacterium]|nr:TetR/AcrR family transcriptional regulator [Chromatiales bacterium]
MARDTRRRITETCLLLFNEAGEPAVSTNQIADAVDISPGNLYYHFRRKSDIVTDLFDLYRTRITPLLEVPEQAVLHVDDAWLLLHLMFETVWDYRFIYRDLDSLLGRYDSLRARLQRVIRGKE